VYRINIWMKGIVYKKEIWFNADENDSFMQLSYDNDKRANNIRVYEKLDLSSLMQLR
jgi:hypothetical protein